MKLTKEEVILKRQDLLHELIITENIKELDRVQSEIRKYDALLNIIRIEESDELNKRIDDMLTDIKDRLNVIQTIKSQIVTRK